MKQKNLVLMVVAVGCGLVAAFLTAQMRGGAPTIEEVDVISAGMDLPTGTRIKEADLDKIAVVKKVPKSALPQQYVVDKKELVGKMLQRGIRKGEVFNPADLGTGPPRVVPEGMKTANLPMDTIRAGPITPGAIVDIRAAVNTREGNPEERVILPEAHILTVNGEWDGTKPERFQTVSFVTFAVTEKQAKVLGLAQQRNCRLSLNWLPTGESTEAKDYDIDETIEWLKSVRKEDQPGGTGEGGLNPRPTTETVEVLFAKEPIAANTEITAELVAEKFYSREWPKELAAGMCTDLEVYLGHQKAITKELVKDAPLMVSMVGDLAAKPSPQDPYIPAKGDGGVATAPNPKPKDVTPPKLKWTRDILYRAPSGMIVYRYESDNKDGPWTFQQTLTPEQAAAVPGNPVPEESDPDQPKLLD